MEVWRKKAPLALDSDGEIATSDCAIGPNGNLPMSSLSLWWMLLPFTLIGFGEVLINVTLYDYTFSAAPVNMRVLAQGFQLLCQGSMSSSFSVVLNLLMESWNTHADNNHNNLEFVYVIFGMVQFLGVVLVMTNISPYIGQTDVANPDDLLDCANEASDHSGGRPNNSVVPMVPIGRFENTGSVQQETLSNPNSVASWGPDLERNSRRRHRSPPPNVAE